MAKLNIDRMVNDVVQDILDKITESYVPMSVIESIRAEIEHEKDEAYKMFGHALGFDKIAAYDKCIGIIDRHISRKDKE